MKRTLLSVLALCALLALTSGASCFGDRRGLSRDALLKALDETEDVADLPTLPELLALRAPAPPSQPSSLRVAHDKEANALTLARRAAARGDIALAKRAWDEGLGVGDTGRHPGPRVLANELQGDAGAHRCLVSTILRDTEDAVQFCVPFLDRFAADPRAVAVARMLARADAALSRAGRAFATRGTKWVETCAAGASSQSGPIETASCADLAYVVAEERLRQARIAKDDAAHASALAASARLHRAARVEGPYFGDLRTLFADDAAGRALPKPPGDGALFESTELFIDDDGLWEPARAGIDGLWRVTFLTRAERASEAIVYLGGTSATRVRVDGVVVAERKLDEAWPGTVRGGVALGRGAHVVEVLTYSTGSGDRLSVSFLTHDGKPALSDDVGDVAREAPPAAREKVARDKASGARALPPNGAVELLALPLASDAPRAMTVDAAVDGDDDLVALERMLYRFAVARAPSFGVDVDETRQLARALVARFGWSPLALAIAAEAHGEDRSVPDRVSTSTAAQLWREVRKFWPDHPVARISEARDLREERPDQALAAYRELVKTQPRYAFGHRELIDLLMGADVVDEARHSADALLHIDESATNIDAALPALQATGDAARAASLEGKRALLDDDLTGTRRARRLLQQGKTADGLAALDVAAAKDEGGALRQEHLALLALRDAPAALAAVERLLASSRATPRLALLRVQLLAATRGTDAARDALLDAMPRLRDDERARKLAEDLGVAPPWTAPWGEDRLKLGDDVIVARRKLAPDAAPFPGHGAVALLDDVERVLFEDDSSYVIKHLVIELRSKEVLDRFGEQSLGDDRLVRLRVVKPDGSVVEPERHRGLDDVSLPELAPGDIVERLTVDRDRPTRLGGSFETRSLEGVSTPALQRRYILSFPRGWNEARGVDVLALNGMAPPQPARFVDGEGRQRERLVFALENVDATPNEPFMPDRSETARAGGYAWGVDDALWSRLRGTGVEQDAQRDAWLDECARRIAGNGADDDEKLRRIFAFVARRIEPAASPSEASAVLASGEGRRTALLVALLRAAGIDAAPVALQLASQPPLETLDGDSWSVLAVRARVAAKDGPVERFAIVDGNAVLDQLPPSARGARVLDVSTAARLARDGAAGLTSTLPDAAVDGAGVRVQVDLTLDTSAKATADAEPGGKLTGLVVVTVPAAGADAARRGARRATPEQLRAILERALADSLPGVRVLDVKVPDLDAYGTALRLGAKVEVPLPALVDGAARFEHLFAQGASGGLALTTPPAVYLGVAERKQAVLVLAEREVLEVQITLPPPATFVEAPATVSARVGPLTLEQQVQITDGRLYWRRELTKENARVPVADWATWRAGLAGIVAKTDARLSFVSPSSSPASAAAAAAAPPARAPAAP